MPGETGEVAHILVVDDDAMVRQMITNFIKEGYHRAPDLTARSGSPEIFAATRASVQGLAGERTSGSNKSAKPNGDMTPP